MNTDQAFQRLSALCARGEHCRYDMLEKMRQWDMTEAEQNQILQRLASGKYVDDERYTRAFVHDKIHYNQWGRKKIEQALWLKHIDADIIKSVMGEIDDSSYTEVLKPLLKQKRKSVKAKNDYEQNQKLIRWAMGRGYTMDIIRQCIDVSDEDEFLD